MSQPDLIKRIVLSRFWQGDIVWHRTSGERGIVICSKFWGGDGQVRQYDVVFRDRQTVTCDELELSHEKVFDVEPKDDEGAEA